jgi:hypothetical protein
MVDTSPEKNLGPHRGLSVGEPGNAGDDNQDREMGQVFDHVQMDALRPLAPLAERSVFGGSEISGYLKP